jgi:hypothetical protein
MRYFRSIFAALAMVVALLLAALPVALAMEVDPSTLTPPPPPDARCHTTGPDRVVCDTVLNQTLEAVPDFFDAPCGPLYLTGTDFREGFRFYEDGLMVRRHVTGDFRVIASLSPTGAEPTIRLFAHWNWWHVWPIPGGTDEEGIVTETGMSLKAVAPGIGSAFQIAGRFDPDGDHTGRFTAFSEDSFAALCAALTD